MTPAQLTALAHPCLLAAQSLHPRFGRRLYEGDASILLTVNRGYE